MDTVPASGSAEGGSFEISGGERREGDTSGGTAQASSAQLSGVMQEALGRVGDAASDVIEQAKVKGGALANTASSSAKDLLGQRLAAGGQWIGSVAESTKQAADSFDNTTPGLAGLVRQASASIEGLASELQSRSVDELVQTAVDFARRRPDVVLGLSALFGFVAVRVLAGTSANRSGQA